MKKSEIMDKKRILGRILAKDVDLKVVTGGAAAIATAVCDDHSQCSEDAT